MSFDLETGVSRLRRLHRTIKSWQIRAEVRTSSHFFSSHGEPWGRLLRQADELAQQPLKLLSFWPQEGFELSPITSNATAAGRALNRRVEALF